MNGKLEQNYNTNRDPKALMDFPASFSAHFREHIFDNLRQKNAYRDTQIIRIGSNRMEIE